jgi:hypothetical protein
MGAFEKKWVKKAWTSLGFGELREERAKHVAGC